MTGYSGKAVSGTNLDRSIIMGGRSSRRGFLTRLGQGSAALAFFPATDLGLLTRTAPPALPVAGQAPDEEYWRLVRAQFALREGIVPMNAANLCPAPRAVIDATIRAAADVDADVSFQNRAKYDELRESVRARLAAYLGVNADEIAIVRNTSEANNIIAAGLPLKTGDEVLVSELNHPTNNVAWDVRAARFGFTVKRVSFPATPTGAAAILGAFEAALTPRTRVLAFTDVSNSTGVRMPTRELCALARARGIHSHVDGAQTFGALRQDLATLGCDSWATSSHKWFMGPKEAGVLYVRAERAPDIWPGSVGLGWGDTAESSLTGARRFETLGQRNDAVFAGLAAALDFHERIGPDRIEARVLALTTAVIEAVASLDGVTPITSKDPALRAGVCVMAVEGVPARALFERLYSTHGFAGAPTGGLRLSPHIYNTLGDIERAVAAIDESFTALRA